MNNKFDSKEVNSSVFKIQRNLNKFTSWVLILSIDFVLF